MVELDDLSLSSVLLGHDLNELSRFQGFGLKGTNWFKVRLDPAKQQNELQTHGETSDESSHVLTPSGEKERESVSQAEQNDVDESPLFRLDPGVVLETEGKRSRSASRGEEGREVASL